MMALMMILKSFIVDPTMLNVSAMSNKSRLPTITGDDFRIAPATIGYINVQNAGCRTFSKGTGQAV